MNDSLSRSDDDWPTARQLLASATETDPAEIADDAAIGGLAEWDSLAHMRLIMALEEHLGMPLPPDSVVAIESLADIVTVLQDRRLSARP